MEKQIMITLKTDYENITENEKCSINKIIEKTVDYLAELIDNQYKVNDIETIKENNIPMDVEFLIDTSPMILKYEKDMGVQPAVGYRLTYKYTPNQEENK